VGARRAAPRSRPPRRPHRPGAAAQPQDHIPAIIAADPPSARRHADRPITESAPGPIMPSVSHNRCTCIDTSRRSRYLLPIHVRDAVAKQSRLCRCPQDRSSHLAVRPWPTVTTLPISHAVMPWLFGQQKCIRQPRRARASSAQGGSGGHDERPVPPCRRTGVVPGVRTPHRPFKRGCDDHLP
jgi:hypothetical protein